MGSLRPPGVRPRGSTGGLRGHGGPKGRTATGVCVIHDAAQRTRTRTDGISDPSVSSVHPPSRQGLCLCSSVYTDLKDFSTLVKKSDKRQIYLTKPVYTRSFWDKVPQRELCLLRPSSQGLWSPKGRAFPGCGEEAPLTRSGPTYPPGIRHDPDRTPGTLGVPTDGSTPTLCVRGTDTEDPGRTRGGRDSVLVTRPLRR